MGRHEPLRWEHTRFGGRRARVLATARCAICGQDRPVTFEHLPPRSTGNQGPGVGFTGEHWLHSLGRPSEPLLGEGISEGSGKVALCRPCNADTAKWYMTEFMRWIRAGRSALACLDPAHVRDRRPALEHATLVVDGADPLAFIKQSVAMLMTTSGAGLGEKAPELRQFVLDPQRRGLPDGFRLYVTLCDGPLLRWSGIAGRIDLSGPRPRSAIMTEIAFEPFALLLTIDTPWDLLPLGDVTPLAENPRGRRMAVQLPVAAGFSHLPYPADYRSGAMILADQGLSAAEGVIVP